MTEFESNCRISLLQFFAEIIVASRRNAYASSNTINISAQFWLLMHLGGYISTLAYNCFLLLANKFKQEIHSKVIRAGKRTYFFDVKSTRNDEYYLTITESKKRYSDNGKFQYEKHKIFLYKEDFDKFADSLEDIIDFIRNAQPEEVLEQNSEKEEELVAEEGSAKDYTNVDFEDI